MSNRRYRASIPSGTGMDGLPCAGLEMSLHVQEGGFPFPIARFAGLGAGYSLVMPSVMMSVILQQEESIRMLSWSTTSTCREGCELGHRGQPQAPLSHPFPIFVPFLPHPLPILGGSLPAPTACFLLLSSPPRRG